MPIGITPATPIGRAGRNGGPPAQRRSGGPPRAGWLVTCRPACRRRCPPRRWPSRCSALRCRTSGCWTSRRSPWCCSASRRWTWRWCPSGWRPWRCRPWQRQGFEPACLGVVRDGPLADVASAGRRGRRGGGRRSARRRRARCRCGGIVVRVLQCPVPPIGGMAGKTVLSVCAAWPNRATPWASSGPAAWLTCSVSLRWAAIRCSATSSALALSLAAPAASAAAATEASA